MPGPTAPRIYLSENQDTILRALERQHTAPQRLIRRVRIIRAAAEGLGLTQSAEHLGLSLDTVQTWRKRWRAAATALAAVDDAPEALDERIRQTLGDAPRSGTPPRFSAEQVAQLIALGCEAPTRYGRAVTHWTPGELAEEAIEQGIVDAISPRTVGRFLKRGRRATASESLLAHPRD